MEIRLCKACHKEKPLKQFYKSSLSKDGYEGKCKLCKINRVRIHEKKPKKSLYFGDWNDYFRLINPGLKDYSLCYGFLSKIGYDPSKDIHQQFCEKYGLTPIPRNKKDENKYSYSDCI